MKALPLATAFCTDGSVKGLTIFPAICVALAELFSHSALLLLHRLSLSLSGQRSLAQLFIYFRVLLCCCQTFGAIHIFVVVYFLAPQFANFNRLPPTFCGCPLAANTPNKTNEKKFKKTTPKATTMYIYLYIHMYVHIYICSGNPPI